ncbi:hypothetical protein HNQ91_001738 [Filimonas zeae]|uniref:Collagen-binding protein n=1 Tax=Filimonas zeae TaxID=1737353 RepID=A0A917IYG8_9BACT|nr:TonB-dependent receptor [Filimonas zeae]MDR6338687.1 hypothetical protein [Filimonas zeae]GGH67053.1 collagen-binding protein [Filimonas zeae]
MIRISFSVLLIMLLQHAARAQTGSIRGKVLDSAYQTVIEGADVFLFPGESSKARFQTRTGGKGFYFRQIPEGSYRLVIAAVGFVNDTTILYVKKNDTLQLDLALHPQENILNDVVVSTTPKPVTVRGDTLSFLADAFNVRPNSQLEDLLRKIPGADVDNNGNITFQGQRIDKITINGKDLFIGDIKNANSLPAEMIAAIEVYSTQSERAKFSRVKENSETRTLNIKTKKGMEEAWVGNTYISKGQKNSYAGGGQITRLGADLMVNSNLKVNNINNRFIGVENKMPGPQTGIQSTAVLDLNLTKKWGNKLTTAISFKGNNQKTEALQTTSRRTFFTDSSLLENRRSQSLTTVKNYPINMLLTYNADSMNQWQLSSSITHTRNSGNNQDTANIHTLYNTGSSYTGSNTQTSNAYQQNSFSINNQLEWRHRFIKPGRTIQVSASQFAQTGSAPGSLFSILNSFAPTGNLLQQTVTNQRYTQTSKGNGYGSSVMYTEPLFNRHNLSLIYSFATQQQQNDKRSNDYDSLTGEYDKPNPLTTNRFNNRNTTHRLESGFGGTGEKFNYQLGLGWQYSTLDNFNFEPVQHIKQHFTNLFPRANVNVNLSKGKSLSFNYNGNSTSPAIDQLQPVPDLSNPLFIKTGNPDLKQSFAHNFSVNLNSYNLKTFNGLMLSAYGDVIHNQIVSSTTLLAGGVQQQQFVNVNGTWHMSTYISYSFAIGRKKGQKNSASISSRLRFSNDAGLINGMPNKTNSISLAPSWKFNYDLTKKLSAELMGGSDFSAYRYSVNAQQNTKSQSHIGIINLNYELPLGINIYGSFSCSHQNTYGLLPSQTNYILNAAIFKRLFTNQRWQVRLSGFDLLNTNRSYSQSASQNYIYTRQTNQLQRMVLVSLLYDFKNFPNQKK